ncbi:phosphoribosyltransferase [Patescibacteria group bacterium]|uniref:Phosphoribosyltransferase n=1 Tax=candidate division WWE3 bacterium TaxID=2053526 RepID=A0A928TVC3_UNCKA|nr:phosphoribosyltransferase [candidate division WWE3 bacterium]MCL4732688.1 phosphoribosyltransferase [Patescibacteria group bacterium]
MPDEELLNLLEQAQAIVLGSHFVYASGRHGDAYVNKDAMYMHPLIAAQIAWRIADEVQTWKEKPEIVLGAAVAGAILAQLVASHVELADASGSASKEVLAAYADKDGGRLVIRRGYDAVIPGRNVLVVEDVLTTGATATFLVTAVRRLNGRIIGVASICNRGKLTAESIGVETLFCLLNLDLVTYSPEECPLCSDGVPIRTDLGHGRDVLAAKAGT